MQSPSHLEIRGKDHRCHRLIELSRLENLQVVASYSILTVEKMLRF